MWYRAVIVVSFALVSFPASAAADDPANGQKNVRRIERIADIPSYLERLHQTVAMAKKGDHGSVKKRDMDRILVAEGQIESILHDRSDDSGLTEDQRLELFNSQEIISAVLRDNDDARIVCTRLPGNGTRLTQKECLTVGQRKARAAQARDAVGSLKQEGSIGCVRDPVTGACQ